MGSKVEGWRKLGIGLGAITVLSTKDIDPNTALIIGTIAITGIIVQGILDWKTKKGDSHE